MFRVLFFITVLVASAGLSACSTPSRTFSNNSPQIVASPDKVSALLADAADRASKSLETLAAVEYAQTPGVAASPVSNAPPELRRAITVSWVGPVEPIAKTLADRAGYKFRVVGSAPPNALVVSINAQNQPVIDVLQNVGLQLGLRADVRVDGSKRMVEVHYASNSKRNET